MRKSTGIYHVVRDDEEAAILMAREGGHDVHLHIHEDGDYIYYIVRHGLETRWEVIYRSEAA